MIRLIFLIIAMLASMPASALTNIIVDKSQQLMIVSSDDGTYSWPVSTARAGYHTPTGVFHVQSMEKMHYSRLYELSPMPYSIFFNGNIAIHGTPHISGLGTPKSHGCVRIHPDNAKTLYEIVSRDKSNTTIIVQQ